MPDEDKKDSDGKVAIRVSVEEAMTGMLTQQIQEAISKETHQALELIAKVGDNAAAQIAIQCLFNIKQKKEQLERLCKSLTNAGKQIDKEASGVGKNP